MLLHHGLLHGLLLGLLVGEHGVVIGELDTEADVADRKLVAVKAALEVEVQLLDILDSDRRRALRNELEEVDEAADVALVAVGERGDPLDDDVGRADGEGSVERMRAESAELLILINKKIAYRLVKVYLRSNVLKGVYDGASGRINELELNHDLRHHLGRGAGIVERRARAL